MGVVSYEVAESVATITLDDGKANALTFAAFDEINAALDRAEADGAGVLLVGRDGRFSAGFDLKVVTAGGPDTTRLVSAGFDLSHRLLSYPRPVVIACTGHAFAMGSFLLLSGDHRIGIRDGGHTITANEVAIGMTMPRPAIEICRQRLSTAEFERAVILAAKYDHVGAVRAGFLDEVVDGEALLDHARATAAQLMTLNMRAHAITKQRCRKAMLDRLRDAIESDRTDANLLG
jgi:enoyl-CoA hydratase